MRIGIVNDMALAREALRRVIVSAGVHQVAWTAHDGAEAVALAASDRPDLILMDLIMPRMDGVEATRRIMAETPCPIVIVTSSVNGHMNKVYAAMFNGALDVTATPSLGPRGEVEGASGLLEKIATIGMLVGAGAAAKRSERRSQPACLFDQPPLVLLGASTGGPEALGAVLEPLAKRFDVCVIMIQHLDAIFFSDLAQRLGARSGRSITLAAEGDRPAPGRWLLAGTEDHLVMSAGGRLSYNIEPRQLCFRPSVDVFFASVAVHWQAPGVAALLTGMGRDGASGLKTLRELGWHTIAQDKETSAIWGMPKVAADIGAAVEVLPISRIGESIAAKIPR